MAVDTAGTIGGKGIAAADTTHSSAAWVRTQTAENRLEVTAGGRWDIKSATLLDRSLRSIETVDGAAQGSCGAGRDAVGQGGAGPRQPHEPWQDYSGSDLKRAKVGANACQSRDPFASRVKGGNHRSQPAVTRAWAQMPGARAR